MAIQIKTSDESWVSLKSGDQIKLADESWQTLKDTDQIKLADGSWIPIAIGSILTFTVRPNFLLFQNIPEGPEIVLVTVSGPDKSWFVDNSPSWITTLIVSDTVLRVTAAANTPGNPMRFGEIILEENNEGLRRLINVTQEAGD